MSLITWNESYSVKVARCDDDHKKLFELINELHDTMKAGKGSQIIQNIVQELANYTRYHFGCEEALMEKVKYPEIERHREQHRVFVGHVEDFQRKLLEGKTSQSIAVQIFLRDWLVNHIQQTDKRYGLHLNAAGVS